MNIKIKAINKGKEILIDVNELNKLKVRKRLEYEKELINNQLKEYKKAGLIGTISYPRNKVLQPKLDKLTKHKQIIKKSIQTIIQFFK